MKKNIIFFFFLCIRFLSIGQNVADYTVYYDFQFITDTIENTFSAPEECMLLRVGEESRFMSSGKYYNDSISAIFTKEYPEPAVKTPESIQKYLDLISEKLRVNRKSERTHFKIIKNFETNTFISIRMFSMLPVEYMEESMDFDWDITNEADTILGLSCMKATTTYGGRRYNAWFTLDVPINDGPYVFQGLPGLILKVTDDQGWYTFTVKNILTEKTNRYIKPDWINQYSQKIDRQAFVEKMIELKHNPRMPAGVLNYPEEQRLERKKAYEKRFDLLIESY